MAVFHSKYRGLSFNVGDEVHRFQDGKFTTDDSKVIAVLEKMRNVIRIDEPAKPKAEVAKEAPAKAEDKPKAASKRKASAK